MIQPTLNFSSGGFNKQLSAPDISITNLDSTSTKEVNRPAPTGGNEKPTNKVAPLPGHGLDDMSRKAEAARNVKTTAKSGGNEVSKTTAKKNRGKSSGVIGYVKNNKLVVGIVVLVLIIGIAR